MHLQRLVLASAAAVTLLPAASHAQVAGFTDIPPTHWAADSVAHLAAAGIIRGNSQTPLGGVKPPKKKAVKTVPGAYDGNKPVTRYELAVTLYRFVQYIEQADKQPKSKFGAQATPLAGPDALKLLLAGGYLRAGTPLAKDGNRTETADQLADALAQVIARSREKTTPPSPDSNVAPVVKPRNVHSG